MEEKSALLNNAIDALDRLFDRRAGVIDVSSILYATGIAIRPDALALLFFDAASSLTGILRTGAAAEEAREAALHYTHRLRLALADALEE